MMIGLGSIQISQTDQCLDYTTRMPIPCYPKTDNMLCFDENMGQQGKCSQLPNGTPVPIVTLQEALAQCSGKQGACEVITAAPCDPLFVAAGFQNCQNQGYITVYSDWLKDYTGANQYDAPITPKTLNLSPADVYYLMNNNLIAPITNSGQTLVPTYNPVSTGPSAPPPTVYSFSPQGTIQVNTTPANVPVAQPTQIPVNTNPQGSLVPQAIPGGTIPGSNTAIGGTATMTPTAAPSAGNSAVAPRAPTTDGTTDPTQLLAGIPNTYLYIGGAVLALLLLKK